VSWGLLTAEMRRALHRRVVWVLLLLALAGIATLGLVAFFDSAGKTPSELSANGTPPALMADWWIAESGDSILLISAIPLLIGGILGGASVAGAEWRAGTVSTILTWEPRRLRLHMARTASALALAAAIAFLLQALFLAAAVPAVLAHGSTAGVDGPWAVALLAGMGRIALLTGGAAVVGVSLATMGRSSTFALGVVFGWMAVGESLVRGLKPGLRHLLIGENVAIAISWAPLEGTDFSRSGVVAMVTLAVYFGVTAFAAAALFTRRDIAGAG